MSTNYLVTQPGPVCAGPASPTPHLAWGVYSGTVLSGLIAGQQAALQIDGAGNLLVNVAVGGGGGGGGTVNQGTPGLVTAPWFVELSDGTNPVGTGTNPLRIDPTGTTVQPTQDAADGTVGAAAPTIAILGGTQDTGSGNLVELQSTNGLLDTSANINSTFIAQGSATWNSGTALNAELDSAAFGTSASFSLVQTGTLTAGAIVFEQSGDSTDWSPISLLDNTTNTLVTGYTFVSGVNRTFSIGFTSALIRARLSVAIVGSGSVAITQVTNSIATPQASVAVTPAIGVTGQTAPTSANEVGGVDTNGLLQALHLDSSQNLKVTVVPQVPGNNGVVQPQLVKTDPTTNDLLRFIIMELRAMRLIWTALATEDNTAKEADFDPTQSEEDGTTLYDTQES